jgi:hypothetical protein
MSHPDPLFDPDNAYEDDDMILEDEYEYRDEDRDYIDKECLMDNANYDDYDAFYSEGSSSYHPDADHEIASQFDEDDEKLEDNWDDSFDDSMDGDAESAFGSCGWGTDETYGYYGDDE